MHDRATQVDRSADSINFGIGQPDFALLPHALMGRTAAARLAEGDTELLNYGFPQGDGRFRWALASFLFRRYGVQVDHRQLMITAGASQALSLACTLLARPGDTVFVEEPSYFLALRILQEDHRLNAIPIATDADGLPPEAVEDALTRHKPVFLYTVPTFQNPTGRTLPRDRRRKLLALAREHRFRIVADEVYHLLDFGTRPPPPFAAEADSGLVLSLGSFSKILAPGLRLGWVQTSPQLARRFAEMGLADSGGGLNHFTSNLVRVALEEGWLAGGAPGRPAPRIRTAHGGRWMRPCAGTLATAPAGACPTAASSSGSPATNRSTPARCCARPCPPGLASCPAPAVRATGSSATAFGSASRTTASPRSRRASAAWESCFRKTGGR